MTKEREVTDLFQMTDGPTIIPDSYKLGVAPWDFPWRIWGHRRGIGLNKVTRCDPVLADLRASQKFVRFVQLTWLNELYRDSSAVPDGQLSLFRPADFFKYPEEIEAYEKHRIQLGVH